MMCGLENKSELGCVIGGSKRDQSPVGGDSESVGSNEFCFKKPRWKMPKDKVVWNWELESHFIMFCNQARINGHLTTSTFSSAVWQEMALKLNALSRKPNYFNEANLRTKWKNLKSAWRVLYVYKTSLGSSMACFRALVNELTTPGNLVNSEQARVSIDEKVAIFLRTVVHQHKHRILGERFQHSTETINKAIHQVLKALLRLSPLLITPPDFTTTPSKVLNSTDFYPYFEGVVGAMDGSLVPAWVPTSQQMRFRSRKGSISQNVLAICDFNLVFTYVYVGWEGSACDAHVLSDALSKDNYFPWHPEGKMYLVDACFANYDCFLAPYRSTRYHLQEFRASGTHPTTPKKLFNLHHSKLRNVVERCFGVLKSRFPVLKYGMPSYSIPTQVDMVIACCVIHNFIRRFGMPDMLFDHVPDEVVNPDPTLYSAARNATSETIDEQSERRNAIADAMWLNRGVY